MQKSVRIHSAIGALVALHRSGNAGPATELGFNPAKGLYSIFTRQ